MYYINDRLICTLGRLHCVSQLSIFGFGRQNLTYLNALQTKKNIINKMQRLFEIATTGKKNNQIFKLTNALLKRISRD